MEAADFDSLEKLSQKHVLEKRLQILGSFNRGEIKTLLVTRGFVSTIDTMTLNVLVSFEVPKYSDNFETNAYLDSVGRVGRNGECALVFNLLSTAEFNFITQLQTKFKMNATTFFMPQ